MKAVVLGSVFTVLFVTAQEALAANWLQWGYDQQHSGNNTAETGYSTASGNRLLYHVGYPSYSSVGSDSAPVFLSGVSTPSGVKDLLFVLMATGVLEAVDAATGATMWQQTVTGDHGLNASPAIDPNLQYVYAAGLDGKVHKYGAADGAEIVDTMWPEVSSLKPDVEHPSSALSIATAEDGTNFLYSVVTGYGDNGDYQGHVTAINLATGSQTVFNALCSNLSMHFVENGTVEVNDCDVPAFLNPSGIYPGMAGIWGRPGVTYDPATNRIYFATGNGPFDANLSGGSDWGDSVLSLNPDGSGLGLGWPVDSYTPSDYTTLYDQDSDLGSGSPLILPSTSSKYPHLALQPGKDGCVRLINLDDMSGSRGPGHVGGELNSATNCTTDGGYLNLSQQPAVWIDPNDGSTRMSNAQTEKELEFDSLGNPSLTTVWSNSIAAITSPVFANGTLYVLVQNQCDGCPAIYAVDSSVGSTVWFFGPTSPGAVHWASPIVVNGHIYYLDSSGLYAIALDGIFRQGFQ